MVLVNMSREVYCGNFYDNNMLYWNIEQYILLLLLVYVFWSNPLVSQKSRTITSKRYILINRDVGTNIKILWIQVVYVYLNYFIWLIEVHIPFTTILHMTKEFLIPITDNKQPGIRVSVPQKVVCGQCEQSLHMMHCTLHVPPQSVWCSVCSIIWTIKHHYLLFMLYTLDHQTLFAEIYVRCSLYHYAPYAVLYITYLGLLHAICYVVLYIPWTTICCTVCYMMCIITLHALHCVCCIL